MTTPTTHPVSSILTRRRALSGAAGLGLSLPLLAACGGGSDDSASTGTDPATTSAGTPSSAATSSAGEPGATESTSAAVEGLTPTADVPVGGGVVLTDAKLVVTQPSAGEFKCFSGICTHTGCPINNVTTTINCICHGSTFDLSTGEVLGGPASAPLAESAVSVDGDQVVLA